MSKSSLFKFAFLLTAFVMAAFSVQARPEYLRRYAADPLSKPELRKCSLCHTNPAGGGPRNEFGKAFAAAGLEFTSDLRQKFPDNFLSEISTQGEQPAVSFVPNSDSEAIVVMNGKRFVINTKDKTVKEMGAAAVPAEMPQDKTIAATQPKREEKHSVPDNVFRPGDVRVINLPTVIPIPKGSLWTDFTHRFPFGEPSNKEQLFGLDSVASPSFGFIYGVTDRIQVGAYRSPTNLGRPIELFAGATLLDEQKGDPLSLMARVALEGRDNFQRNFATSFEFTFARSITRHAQIYVVPTITLGDRPFGFAPDQNMPGETATALGIGAAVNIRPTVAILAEANMRLNEASRYVTEFSGIHRPVFGFGIQKVSVSRRHSFSLTFTNGYGTTFSQRSMTRGIIGADDSPQGLTIGFNLSRRLF
ncbi:MAG: DUF5777 family beta-barrel protein [Acidobacteriota bacterium]